MIAFNGIKFAKNNKEFIDSLFHKGGTCYGYYKKTKGGVQLLDKDRNIFAFIVDNSSGQFIVSASRLEDRRIRYMYSTSTSTDKLLGLDGLGDRAMTDECKRILSLFEVTCA